MDKWGDAVDNSLYLRLSEFENPFTMAVQGFSHPLTTGELSTIVYSYPQARDNVVTPSFRVSGKTAGKTAGKAR
ncbi:hypothetical protein HMPREF0290_2865 [Corynebacterium efficiens YS-314]|uniref:Uncharacterized protein n=1 Tax=Corynebacterium efficiens (strain DSM 44549 / YS-314 / AJ 12310 / JCM 11189 / NBRC 100395) TaxID=196164 RepID=Q8FLQ1_COREF|nr:hypothetical protein HMPREF0290_2865 [Corynebacterium efficiens YS-314]BAC19627.1 hypothetical protein [Corynebacterium efficiens YS-314]